MTVNFVRCLKTARRRVNTVAVSICAMELEFENHRSSALLSFTVLVETRECQFGGCLPRFPSAAMFAIIRIGLVFHLPIARITGITQFTKLQLAGLDLKPIMCL